MRAYHCKIFLAAWLLLAAGAIAWAQDPNGPRTLEQLRDRIEAHLVQPRFSGAIWGVKIVSLDSGKIIFEHYADRLMSPASNSKLYTAALALDRLGGAYRFATPVYAQGAINDAGTLRGNLIVVGHGDPSWNERRLGTNFWALFEPYAAILANAGVRRIEGDVLGDATFFWGRPTGSSWSVADVNGGGMGLISALMLDDNVAEVRVDPGGQAGVRCSETTVQPGTGLVFINLAVTAASNSSPHLEWFRPPDGGPVYILGELPLGGAATNLEMSVPQPAAWFAAALKLALARHGIPVRGQARGLAWPDAGTGLAAADSALHETNTPDGRAIRLGTVYSPPLREVVRDFLKPSQNLETDSLLAHIGEMTRASNAPPWQTSEEAGLAELGRFLVKVGVVPGAVQFDEGSGLSRNNLATAEATVTLLQFMAAHREADAFREALPVAGVDGTLSQRFVNTPAAGNVRAKTGTLRWAQALSGYVTTAAGEHLVFSIMLNRFAAPPGHSGHEEIDPLVVMLAGFGGRSSDSP